MPPPLPFVPPAWRPRLRRMARAAIRTSLRLRARPYPIERAGRTLFLAPHQDDATLGCGGLIVRRREEALDVSIAYITDGAASHPGHPALSAAGLAARRAEEARIASGRLGVDYARVSFLGLPDGRLDRLSPREREDALRKLQGLLASDRPDEIFLPCSRDGSSEHEAAYDLAREAVRQSGLQARMLEYPIWAWWNPLRLIRPLRTSARIWRVGLDGQRDAKARALAAYSSQIEPVPPWTQPVLPPEFVAAFLGPDEFFFEPPPA